MATKKKESTELRLGFNKVDGKSQLVRFSHANLFAWKMNPQSKKEAASVEVWIPKQHTADIELARAAVAAQIAEYKRLYGDPGPEFHNPLIDGDTAVDQKGKPKPRPGVYIISAKILRYAHDGTENDLPDVRGTARDPETNKLLRISAKDMKSGDWGRISINLSCFEQGKGGVGAYLNTVQKVRNGDPLSSRKTGDEVFGDYDDEEEDDPLA